MRALYRTINLSHRDILPTDPTQPEMRLQQDDEGFFSLDVDGPHVVSIVTGTQERENGKVEFVCPEQRFEFPDHASARRFLNHCARAEDQKAWDKFGGTFVVSIFWMGRKTSPSSHEVIELAQPVAAPMAPTCPPHCGHSDAQHAAFDRGLQDGQDGAWSDDLPAEYRGNFDLTEAWLTGHSVGRINASE